MTRDEYLLNGLVIKHGEFVTYVLAPRLLRDLMKSIRLIDFEKHILRVISANCFS